MKEKKTNEPLIKFYGKNTETAEFDNCMVVVKHSAHPIALETEKRKIFQYETDNNTLLPRSAVIIFK